ncbi:hypothetical protein [Paenibacillus montanisoli]|uniref:Uncharacterized protein n=1 Tax=Paenibacillus montanisoli TaxID=2081970 RepID=A0A328U9B9_9BACL|nr:hypothetical protein [Paenibacillus montanisoli]RAP76666.1 hypothetical protein DL346_15025 [Paenibacillus montanisoli]
MTSQPVLSHKISLLRTVELLCYQVSHYLLRSEKEAAAASKEALTALFSDPRFLEASDEERCSIARKTAISAALQRASLSCAHAKKKELTSHVQGNM